ncbi:hypothetical protein T484DRAFT_1826360 [Baffinella frigidus]|nr:hypothetical protein T484DRAFT_1826360 [Cryptophyta sp. CCMP2293]
MGEAREGPHGSPLRRTFRATRIAAISQEQQRHQQIVEDLVNDLLSHSSSFPPRRRHQRPPHPADPSNAASCIPLEAPLVQGPSGPPAIHPLALLTGTSPTLKKHHSLRSLSREASRDPTPTKSRKHDSLRCNVCAHGLSAG